MKRLARLVVRPSDNEGKSALVLGSLTAEGVKRFGSGRVLEITLLDILDEVSISDVGASWIQNKFVNGKGKGGVCWGHDVNSILENGGKHIFLTEAEFDSLYQGNHD
jgi:hypothetical protein